MLSEIFFKILREKGPLHETAWNAGLTPNQVYRITGGIDRPGPDDPRVIRLCMYLGISVEKAFEGEA